MGEWRTLRLDTTSHICYRTKVPSCISPALCSRLYSRLPYYCIHGTEWCGLHLSLSHFTSLHLFYLIIYRSLTILSYLASYVSCFYSFRPPPLSSVYYSFCFQMHICIHCFVVYKCPGVSLCTFVSIKVLRLRTKNPVMLM